MKKYLKILAILVAVIIAALWLFGGSESELVGDEIQMTRFVFGSELTPNGLISVPFSADSEDYDFINIAVDLNKDGVIGAYETDGKTQEEWLARDSRVHVSAAEGSSYPIAIPDKTLEELGDFQTYILLSKNKLDDWDGQSDSGGLLKEAKISALERADYAPYYSPDPEGIRAGGSLPDWFAPKFAFADNSIPDFPPGFGAGAAPSKLSLVEFHSGVPDINQEHNECVPTSIANSLVWLGGKNKFLDLLPPGGGSELIAELKQDLNWGNLGVFYEDVISGINTFTARHDIPLEAYQVGEEYDPGIIKKIAEELKMGRDVEVWLQYLSYLPDGSVERRGAHVVTVVGVWASDGSEFLGIHDPLTRSRDSLDMYRIEGARMVDYAFQRSTVTYIRYAFAESPLPEDQIPPSIKIESIKSTLKQIRHPSGGDERTCTIEASGTVTGPTCSGLSSSNGEIGGADGCPNWTYWGTSGICIRKSNNSKTTKWNVKFDQLFSWGETKGKFTAKLSVPKLPLPLYYGTYGDPVCSQAETEKVISDSIDLTCN